jgi:Rrf2 family transcriptional repressor of oqxAB
MRSSTTGNLASPNWFVAAVLTLIFLARADSVCSSAMIATYVHSHATFLRRVIARLVRAGLVLAHEGRDGGYCLACPASHITLADVYQAVKPRGADSFTPLDTSRGPLLEGDIHTVLAEILGETEQGVLEVLQRHTIAELAARTETPELDKQ